MKRKHTSRDFRGTGIIRITGILLCLCLMAAHAEAQGGLPTGNTEPIATLLNPDGTLNLDTGFSGSLNLAGYRMVTGPNGEPRFVSVANQSSIPGTNNSVVAVLADGLGNVYIGGGFTVAGDVPANYIAKWDGTRWSPLGSGINGPIEVLAMNGTDLYAGGSFTTAGGVSANNVAKWNGSSWSALGTGTNGGVSALAVSGTTLYAGGGFTTAGGVPANYIARWNGSAWSALGTGMNQYGYVWALAFIGTDLYAGGYFATAGGVPAMRIAKWNGTSWSALASGVGGYDPTYPSSLYVNALAVIGTDLYAGGGFLTAGGISASNIAKWNGSSWSALGQGMNSVIEALAVSGSDLYAGGYFTTAGDVSANRVARWSGSTWSAVGTGISGPLPGQSDPIVYALAVSGSDLYAGGGFTTAGGVSARNIAKWDGSTWSALEPPTAVDQSIWGMYW